MTGNQTPSRIWSLPGLRGIAPPATVPAAESTPDDVEIGRAHV